MIRWSPSTELASLHGAMDRLIEDFFGPSPGADGGRPQLQTYALPLDVREIGDHYEIQAPVPGFKPEEVEVTFSGGVLTIRARHSEQARREEGGFLRREVAYGDFQRSIQMPAGIEEDGITASFEDGMLTLVVPKVPRPQPKRIQVSRGPEKQLSE